MNISIGLFILNLLVNYILIKELNLGFDGSIISRVILDISNFLSLYI